MPHVNAYCMSEQKKIGARLLLARDKLGMSQQQFAKYFNVKQCTISRWENSEIHIDARTLFWIEHVLCELGFVYANKQRVSQ